MRTAAVFFLGLILLAGCSQLALTAINAAGANTNFYHSQNSLVTKPGQLPSPEQVSLAHQYISEALTQTPTDADALDLAGRVDYYRAIYEPDPKRKHALFSSSKQQHLAALEQRPLWPYSEVNILYASAALGELDDVFLSRFSRAKKLAPDDREVIADLAKIGIKSWNHLSEKTQAETVELTEKVLKSKLIHTNVLRSHLYNNGQFHRICSRLQQFEEKQRLCNS